MLINNYDRLGSLEDLCTVAAVQQMSEMSHMSREISVSRNVFGGRPKCKSRGPLDDQLVGLLASQLVNSVCISHPASRSVSQLGEQSIRVNQSVTQSASQ